MKKLMILLLFISMLVFLTGCKSIDYGTVIEKSFTPAHRSYQPMVIVGKHTMIIPRWISHPDRWSILIENEYGHDWWRVSEEYYNSVNVGDSVDRRNP